MLAFAVGIITLFEILVVVVVVVVSLVGCNSNTVICLLAFRSWLWTLLAAGLGIKIWPNQNATRVCLSSWLKLQHTNIHTFIRFLGITE